MLLRGVRFTHDVTLGSLITTATAVLMSIWFYALMANRVEEAQDYQRENRRSIEVLSAEVAAYKARAIQQASELERQVQELQSAIQQLKHELQTNGRR